MSVVIFMTTIMDMTMNIKHPRHHRKRLMRENELFTNHERPLIDLVKEIIICGNFPILKRRMEVIPLSNRILTTWIDAFHFIKSFRLLKNFFRKLAGNFSALIVTAAGVMVPHNKHLVTTQFSAHSRVAAIS